MGRTNGERVSNPFVLSVVRRSRTKSKGAILRLLTQ